MVSSSALCLSCSITPDLRKHQREEQPPARGIFVPRLSTRPNSIQILSQLPHRTPSMSSMTLFRLAARTQPSSYLLRSSQPAKRISPRGVYAGSSATVTCTYFSTTVRRAADDSGHHEESFEEFTARYDEHLGTRLSSTCTSSLSAEPKHRGLRQLRRVNWLTGNASRYEKEFDGVQDVFELQV